MNSKTELIAALTEVYNAWDALLSSLPESLVTKPDFHDGMSIKDEVSHLWAWQQVSIARLEAARNDTDPQYPDWSGGIDPDTEGTLDKNNAEIYNANRDRTWDDVYSSWQSGFQKFIELAEATPESDLLTEGAYSWRPDYPLSGVLEGSCDHHREHLEQLQEWLNHHDNRKDTQTRATT